MIGRWRLPITRKQLGESLAFLTGILLLLGCCGTRPKPPEEPQAEPQAAKAPEDAPVDPSIIPRQILFGNPDKAAARISPDGKQLSFLAPVNGVLNVFVGPADNPDAAKPVTQDTKRGIRTYFWAYSNRHIIYLQDKEGDENWRVYRVDLEKGTVLDLTPIDGVHATIQAVSQKFETEILIGLNDRNPQFHDIYKVNINNGEKILIQENTGFAGYMCDDEYNVRFAVLVTEDGGTAYYKPKAPSVIKKEKKQTKGRSTQTADDTEKAKKTPPSAAGPDLSNYDLLFKVEMADSLTTAPIAFDKSGRILFMLDSRGRDTAAFAELNLETKELSIKSEDTRADLQDLMIHPTEKHVQAAGFTYVRKEWKILDETIKADFEFLNTVSEGEMEVVSRTLADDIWIVAYLLDNGPVSYYRYDRATRKTRFLFTNRSELENLPLASMNGIVIPARDGLSLVSYLTLPKETDPDNDGVPEHPLPMVLTVHGGPWARDNWGYNAEHQWLANRGYAVLSVNYRGSTGFGKSFVNAGNNEWAGKMHDDLLDAVQWAVDQKIADAENVAIYGGSYGGYAALVGLTFTPKTFACGVDIVGPSNLITLLSTIPPYWAPVINQFTTRVGDHRTEEGQAFLKSRSPLTFAEKIERPLLIAQGANDPRVKQSESDQITKAMTDNGIPVTYLLYPDEGHGFARPENRKSFKAVAEQFLSTCLGGKREPIGADFEGASIIVPLGGEQIPGLNDALSK